MYRLLSANVRLAREKEIALDRRQQTENARLWRRVHADDDDCRDDGVVQRVAVERSRDRAFNRFHIAPQSEVEWRQIKSVGYGAQVLPRLVLATARREQNARAHMRVMCVFIRVCIARTSVRSIRYYKRH